MDFTKELEPSSIFNDSDPETIYWNNNGQIYFRHNPVKGADVDSFRFYLGSFAKDKKNCYRFDSKISGANPQTFQALNFTYFKDNKSVWTISGRIKNADAETFEVCDEGFFKILNALSPHSFGKDKERVFYYDFDGITNWVRKANPETFISLNDGYFGKDANFAFFGRAIIPNAKVQSWRKLGGLYNKDDSKIFYMNRPIKIADYGTFEVTKTGIMNLAKDKNNYYWNENVVIRDKYDDLYLDSI